MSDNHANSEADRSGRATAPSLRDRILLALIHSTPSEYLPPPNDMSTQVDAVIEALGLQQEDGECGYCHAQLPGCRYVTEWTADE